MKTFKDCMGLPYPVYAQGVVSYCGAVESAVPYKSVYLLKIALASGEAGGAQNAQLPAPGQFYMLHALRSDLLLGRPISVYHVEQMMMALLKFSF